MEPIYIDLHIHTSSNPNSLNAQYDFGSLRSKIDQYADGSEVLVSFTDHNTINKIAYLGALEYFDNILLGAELHIRNYDDARPYHCHMYLNTGEINGDQIDTVNAILDSLYPTKVVSHDHSDIPKLQDIMNAFDEFDILLLPHGGQNHSTFDTSIPDGVGFDKTLERSLYYNFFDGFTARSNKGLEKTHSYFERLGIKEFVNLITASDNYNPNNYPACNAGDQASEFIPTWMLAKPTFNGLRLSLSETSRLYYGEKPKLWAECIQKIYLKNDHVDIDVELTPGLNVVIGGSSSGKSLLVDSMYRKITNTLDKSVYKSTIDGIEDISVMNSSGLYPHYLDQNYIVKICDPKDKKNNIDDISILKSVFPQDDDERTIIDNGLNELQSQLKKLIKAVKKIEQLQEELPRIPALSHLITTEISNDNPLKEILPEDKIIELVKYDESDYLEDIEYLDALDEFLTNNPLIDHEKSLTKKLKNELNIAFMYSNLEKSTREIIQNQKDEIEAALEEGNRELTTKRSQFEKLLKLVKDYLNADKLFYSSIEKISKFSVAVQTKIIESGGNKLFIDNNFVLSKDKFKDVVNEMLKAPYRVERFEDIKPETLYKENYSQRDPKVTSYEDFETRVNAAFSGLNVKSYRILTEEGKDFDQLSAGWKTSVILDLILGWDKDIAPLIIDQPEDNLATSYINKGLLDAIKKCKIKKQVILVSHNATIPMLGDAQNIIMCVNDDQHIKIRSNPLEGAIDGVNVVDLIANTTDGGKASIKKRVKKYNLKSFKEES